MDLPDKEDVHDLHESRLKNSDHGESVSGDECDEDVELAFEFEKELQELPHIADYIRRLQALIGRQRKKLKQLFVKFNRKPTTLTRDAETQTEEAKAVPVAQETVEEGNKEGWTDCDDLTKAVQEVAENALTQAGMVYEPTSGMYYDYKSGYYYNAELRMYYDGNSGRYLVYDEETKQYSYQTQSSADAKSKEKSSEQKRGRKRKHERDSTEESSGDKEAGELTDSSSEEEEDEEDEEGSEEEKNEKQNSEEDRAEGPEGENLEKTSAAWPPCLRLMVLSSSAPGIKVGQLFLVTCQGGDVGREGKPAVLLPEQLVSKVHLKISFKDDSYQIVDVGSRNGTWLNDKRISAALQESESTAISHGDNLRIGSTKLGVHVHAGQDTCEQCEPGLQLQKEVIPAPLPATLSVRSLRKRFGLGKQNPLPPPAPDYKDRAESRRVKVGSSHPAEKTEAACVNQSITAKNKGFKMLEKMGWKEGKCLGKNDQGIKEPVQLVSNEGSTGLGARSYSAPEGMRSFAAMKRSRALQVTKARFSKLPELPPEDDATQDQ